jgi:hypothetical protein
MLRQLVQSAACAQSGLFGHAAVALVAGNDLLSAACRKRVSMPEVGQQRHMSAAVPDDVTSFVKEVWQTEPHPLVCDVLRVLCQLLLPVGSCWLTPPAACAAAFASQAMEILDIPEKLQHAILHSDKSLTVDLRVRCPAQHAQHKHCSVAPNWHCLGLFKSHLGIPPSYVRFTCSWQHSSTHTASNAALLGRSVSCTVQYTLVYAALEQLQGGTQQQQQRVVKG